MRVALAVVVGMGLASGASALDRSVGADGINATALQNLAVPLTGTGIKLGVLDDKIATHPNLTIGGNGGTGVVTTHATEVAGILNSNHATYKGVAPGSTVYGYAVATPIEGFDGANWMVSQGIKIITYPMGWSLGSGDWLDGNSWESLHVDYLAVHNDALMFISGNQGGGGAPLPTDAYNGITVNATVMTASGRYDELAGWNYYGERPDYGRCKPDLVAPGGYEYAPERSPESIYTTTTGNGFVNVSGTSFAAPHAAGAAALLTQYGQSRGLSTNHNVLKAVLVNAADKTTRDTYGLAWTQSEAYGDKYTPLDDELGAGQVDAVGAYLNYAAGHYGPGSVPLVGWDLGSITGEGAVLSYQFNQTLKSGTYLTATLAWDRRVILEDDQDGDGRFDYYQTDILTPFDNNDLDINIYNSTGGLITGSWSGEDNLEHVWWQVPTDGSYRLGVEFYQVNDLATQAYALAWSAVHELGVWTGGLTTRWNTADNWTGRVAPGASLPAVLEGTPTATPTLASNAVAKGVAFRTAGWTISGTGYVLTVGSDGIDSAGAGTNDVRPGVALSADSTWTIDAGNTLVLRGALNAGGRRMTKDGTGTLTILGAQNHAAGSALVVSAGTVNLGTDAGASGQPPVLALTASGLGTVNLNARQHLTGVTLTNAGWVLVAPGGANTLVTKSLSIAESSPGVLSARLDVADNSLIVDFADASPPSWPAMRKWLVAGYNATLGYWDGNGLASVAAAVDGQKLTALGIIDNRDSLVGGRTSFEGEAVDASSLLVKYTYWGDANFDGQVTFDDYDIIDYYYWFPLPADQMGWWTGDLDYDGNVDFDDYDLIDYAYWFQGAPLAGGGLGAVPEPATLALLAVGAALAWRRKRG